MKAGIVVDDWKLPVFERELRAAGFEFEKFPFTTGTTTVRVEFETHQQLAGIKELCQRCEREAQKERAGNEPTR